MKAIKFMIVVAFLAVVSVMNAQKVFTPSSVIDGKTILQMAKEYDVEFYLSTATIYKTGVSESEFVSTLLNNFPPEANKYKELFDPYFTYIYSLHKRGLTQSQAASTVTGVELADLSTRLSSWNANNPGIIADGKKIPWKKLLGIIKDILIIIIPYL